MTSPNDYIQTVVTNHCDFWGVSDYDLPQEFRDNPLLHPYRCPRCGSAGVWRRGVGFEHMKRCCVVWSPYAAVLLRTALAEELIGVFGDGI